MPASVLEPPLRPVAPILLSGRDPKHIARLSSVDSTVEKEHIGRPNVALPSVHVLVRRIPLIGPHNHQIRVESKALAKAMFVMDVRDPFDQEQGVGRIVPSPVMRRPVFPEMSCTTNSQAPR